MSYFFIRKEGKRMNKTHNHIQRITGIAMFAALAYACAVICHFNIPQIAGFLSLDVKDSLIAIASFIYGPITAPIIALLVSFIEFVTISSTGWWGFVMNFASSTVFSLTASLIYKYRKSFTSALVGFFIAIFATTGIMVLLNIWITPIYYGMPRSAVIPMVKFPILPFNIAKSLMNSAIALLLYKPVITALRMAGIIKKGKHKTDFNKFTVITIAVGGASLIAAILILISL
jgi:riboflavin transporter FmnP